MVRRPVVIDDRVARDLIHPGQDPVRILQAIDPLMDAQKHLLQNIVDLCRICDTFRDESTEAVMDLPSHLCHRCRHDGPP